jgi:hypothetical protein
MLLLTLEAQGFAIPTREPFGGLYTAYLYIAKFFDHGVVAPSTSDPLKEPVFTHEVINFNATDATLSFPITRTV